MSFAKSVHCWFVPKHPESVYYMSTELTRADALPLDKVLPHESLKKFTIIPS
jgi:hypothetical protein